MSSRDNIRMLVAITYISVVVFDSVRKPSPEAKPMPADEPRHAPLIAVCLPSLLRDGTPVKNWNELSSPRLFRRGTQDPMSRLTSIGPNGFPSIKNRFKGDVKMTRFKDNVCLWLDWNLLSNNGFIAGKFLESFNVRALFTLQFRFNNFTKWIYVIPKATDDYTLAEEDFNDDAKITVSTEGFIPMAINYTETETFLENDIHHECPESRKCIQNCLLEHTRRVSGAIPVDINFVLITDEPYKKSSRMYLAECKERCRTKNCIATQFTRHVSRNKFVFEEFIEDGFYIQLEDDILNYPSTLMWIHLPNEKIKVYFPKKFQSLFPIYIIWPAMEVYFVCKTIGRTFVIAIYIALAAIVYEHA